MPGELSNVGRMNPYWLNMVAIMKCIICKSVTVALNPLTNDGYPKIWCKKEHPLFGK
jgi:hypothetical protein